MRPNKEKSKSLNYSCMPSFCEFFECQVRLIIKLESICTL